MLDILDCALSLLRCSDPGALSPLIESTIRELDWQNHARPFGSPHLGPDLGQSRER